MKGKERKMTNEEKEMVQNIINKYFDKILKNDLKISDDVLRKFIPLQIVNHSLLESKEVFDDIYTFWKYLNFWYLRDDILKILDISIVTYYNLKRYIENSNTTVSIGTNLLNRIDKTRLSFKWYFEWCRIL